MRAVVFVCAALLLTTAAAADVPPLMSYQGVLADASGNPVPDGDYDITFGLYTVESGGTPDWAETQTLSVEGGIVNAYLGSVVPLGEPLHFDVPYWLSISIEGEPEMSPRTPLTTVPYAGWAVHAIEPTPDDDWVVVEPNMYADVPGNIGIGTTSPNRELHLHRALSAQCFVQLTNSATGANLYDGLSVGASSNTGWVTMSGGPLRLGHGAALNSVNVELSGDVGIGTSTPSTKLDVDGSATVTGFVMPTGAFPGYVLTSDGSGVGTWQPLFAAPASANGTVVLDASGEARVELPATLDGVELDYQLTCIGGFAPVYVSEKAQGGAFTIAGGEPGMEISWMVSAQ